MTDPKSISTTIGPDHITPEEQASVKRLRDLAQIRPSSVLVGIIRTSVPENPRVLLLEGGAMTLLRFSDPILGLHAERLSTLSTLLRQSEKLKKHTGIIESGKLRESAWMRRTFFDRTLSSEEKSPNQKDLIDLVILVAQLHRNGLVHGHLVPENVVLHSEGWKILDAGFCASTPHGDDVSGLAPESSETGALTPASDVYGLGIILSKFTDAFPSREHSFLIEQMLRKNPDERPKIEEVVASLSGKQIKIKAISPTSNKDSKPNSSLLPLLLGGALLFGGGYYYYTNQTQEMIDDGVDYASLFRSGQPSLMSQAAIAAAMEGRPKAQQAAYEVFMSGAEHPSVNSKVLRIGYDPRWEMTLGPNDRKALLALVFFDILPQGSVTLPPPTSLHPAVILSVLGALDVEKGGKQFETVSPAQLGSLPAPIGPAFTALSETGVLHIETGAGRGLTHIVLGDIRSIVIKTFFDDFQDIGATLLRLRVVIPLFKDIRGLEGSVWNELQQPLGHLLKWYKELDLAKWGSVSQTSKLSLLSGAMPEEKISFDQLLDLLRFPLSGVRKEALSKLKLSYPFPPEVQSSLDVLAAQDLEIKREQVISLGNAFLIPSKEAEPFFVAWFDTKPEAQAVLRLIIARDSSGTDDPFTLLGAQYLSKNTWAASLPDFAKLVTHPEPLVRALAYAKLDPQKPQERTMLEKMLPAEGNERNRKLLEGRLH